MASLHCARQFANQAGGGSIRSTAAERSSYHPPRAMNCWYEYKYVVRTELQRLREYSYEYCSNQGESVLVRPVRRVQGESRGNLLLIMEIGIQSTSTNRYGN